MRLSHQCIAVFSVVTSRQSFPGGGQGLILFEPSDYLVDNTLVHINVKLWSPSRFCSREFDTGDQFIGRIEVTDRLNFQTQFAASFEKIDMLTGVAVQLVSLAEWCEEDLLAGSGSSFQLVWDSTYRANRTVGVNDACHGDILPHRVASQCGQHTNRHESAGARTVDVLVGFKVHLGGQGVEANGVGRQNCCHQSGGPPCVSGLRHGERGFDCLRWVFIDSDFDGEADADRLTILFSIGHCMNGTAARQRFESGPAWLGVRRHLLRTDKRKRPNFQIIVGSDVAGIRNEHIIFVAVVSIILPGFSALRPNTKAAAVDVHFVVNERTLFSGFEVVNCRHSIFIQSTCRVPVVDEILHVNLQLLARMVGDPQILVGDHAIVIGGQCDGLSVVASGCFIVTGLFPHFASQRVSVGVVVIEHESLIQITDGAF